MLAGFVGQALNCLLQFQGQQSGLTFTRTGQQHDKAVAGQSAEQIVAAQVEQEQLAEGLKHGITFGVAVVLIDRGKVVDIQRQQ